MNTELHLLLGAARSGALQLGLTVVPARAQTYSIVHSFGTLSNLTGFHPVAPRIQGPDGTLYGTTPEGESRLGLGFTVLKEFTGPEGGRPSGKLVAAGSALFGTTTEGRALNAGVVFRLSLLPSLRIYHSNGVVTVAWEKTAEGWVLERTNVLPSVTVPWPQVSPPYQSNNADFFVTTNAPIGNAFFRLHKP